ncbi:alpha/beta hydrolase [Aquabacterium sp.]|uniref:alpha/beta hydrolase n=1 Tax=Aquabacterium sp. TaxID=1872578 RepID=UPI0035C6747F
MSPSATHAPQPSQAPQAIELQGGTHAVLLFHGLSSSPLELLFLARGLQRAGHTVRLPVISGYTHGFPSSRPRSVHDWVDDALAELDALLGRFEHVSIGGLCVGAVMALRLAALRPVQVRHLVCLSVALHFDGWGNPWFTPLLPLARVLPFARRIRLREREPFGLKDKRMRAWVARQMQQAGGSDAGAATLQVGELLKARELVDQARRSLSNVRSATLLVHAREDENATPRSAFDVATGVRARRIRMALLNDSYHMVSIDQEKHLVLQEMQQFLAPTVAGAHGDSAPSSAQVLLLPEPMTASRP